MTRDQIRTAIKHVERCDALLASDPEYAFHNMVLLVQELLDEIDPDWAEQIEKALDDMTDEEILRRGPHGLTAGSPQMLRYTKAVEGSSIGVLGPYT